MARKKAATPPLKHLVALVGIEHGEWRCEAGDSLSGAPSGLDIEWLLQHGRIGEAPDG